MNKDPIRKEASDLAHDYIHAYNNVRDFYNGDFRDLTAFQDQTEKVNSRHLLREPLAAVLREQNQNYGCGSQTLGNIDKLIHDRACAVVTGQQVGLFSGPLYTIYKSLTVIKLSEHLNHNCQGSFVPVFWLASEDHDFAEINHITLLNAENNIEKVQYRSRLLNKKIPVSKVAITSEISRCIQRLEGITRNSEFKGEILSRLGEAYQPGHSFVEAFARWMTRLFKSYGLIFMDAGHPGLKELGKGVFHREIAENSPSTQRALEASDRLRQAKYHAQIQLHAGILNIFFMEKERQVIQSKNNGFHIKGTGQTYKESELLGLLHGKPDIFSPNVLLRPIYQDAILPTVVYVGGPAEIAYFAQMKGVYESFNLSMPVIYPRKTVTIIEKSVDKVLVKYKLKIQDMWQDTERLINELIIKQFPVSIDKVFSTAASHLGEDFKSIKQEILAIEPTLGKSADLTLGKINQQLKRLEKKILQAYKKRDKTMTQQLHKAKNNLYPTNRLQERVLNIVPFLIKYGFALIDELYQNIDIDEHDHQIVKL